MHRFVSHVQNNTLNSVVLEGIQDGGRISQLIATTALAHPQTARGSHSPAKAADAADAVRLQHGLLRALYGCLAAPARIVATTASTGGPRKKM
ncbi:hypothetical protein NDU88_003118 [Pleurodeles waltl]|uniref:Uncharacterized protein n=1 Tax=Pleurodeles waltl TaxID=8319 RepID=A0AAV7M3G3_PLEWA|nr:hypothetical protein NDU88_003118 [Pleurodeles waltl]